jgi:hypothetical protein
MVADKADIVQRLRAVDHMSIEDCFVQSSLFAYAADEIERLRKELGSADYDRATAEFKLEEILIKHQEKQKCGCGSQEVCKDCSHDKDHTP